MCHVVFVFISFCFFKQKTAYEMRISDWSSDVCSSDLRYVAFETLYDRKQMPDTRFGVLDWPYVEGLRIDEAMHPLAFVSVGMYGKVLPNQDGAPLRLTIPWKYGYKSIKSIVRIRFVERQPPTTWNKMAANERSEEHTSELQSLMRN